MKRLPFCCMVMLAVCAWETVAGGAQPQPGATRPAAAAPNPNDAPAHSRPATAGAQENDQPGNPAAEQKEIPQEAADQQQPDAVPSKPAAEPKPQRGRAANFPKDRLIEELSGRDEKLRLKSLEMISRRYANQPQVADVLIEAVDTLIGEDRVTESTLLMIGMLGNYDRPDVTEALAGWLEDGLSDGRFSPCLVAIMDVLGKIDQPQAVDALTAALGARDYRLVMVAAENLGRYQRQKAFATIRALVRRPEFRQRYGFRFCVLEAISRFQNRESIDLLVSQLPLLDGQLKFRIAQHLTQVFRLPFGGNAQLWVNWWQANRDQARLPAALAPASQDLPWDCPLPSFYQQKIYGKHVIFVIDTSGSMADLRSGQPAGGYGLAEPRGLVTLLAEAQKELCAAIGALPPDAEFNLISFATQASAWRAEPSAATPVNKNAAVSAVAVLRASGQTNVYDAMDMALTMDPNLEVICLLSDGNPTCGRITNPAELLREIAAANRFHRVTINTVSLGGSTDLMRGLAAVSSGTCRVISLPNRLRAPSHKPQPKVRRRP